MTEDVTVSTKLLFTADELRRVGTDGFNIATYSTVSSALAVLTLVEQGKIGLADLRANLENVRSEVESEVPEQFLVKIEDLVEDIEATARDLEAASAEQES